MIRAIDQESIHRICSSQVVVDLANAVKEMVENALDAQATFIEVKLKSMGADSIEVSDNGRGIDPADYEGIALKHHTSKLRNFEDLFSVDSFGFRGEALNALCELSEKFTITTKRANETTGSMLTFDKFGRYRYTCHCIVRDQIHTVPFLLRLESRTVAPRNTGTTVIVEKLFNALPVRRSEFVR